MDTPAILQMLKVANPIDGATLLDDGEFCIEHNSSSNLFKGHGCLYKRINTASHANIQDTRWCVGGYELRNGKWYAELTIPWDELSGTDVRILYISSDRDIAIASLWLNRRFSI